MQHIPYDTISLNKFYHALLDFNFHATITFQHGHNNWCFIKSLKFILLDILVCYDNEYSNKCVYTITILHEYEWYNETICFMF